MPPHDELHSHGDGEHEHGHDDAHPASATGLPVHTRFLRPGALHVGALIAALFAVLAHVRSAGAGLVWDDRVFLLEDPRLRSIASVFTAWTQPFFTPEHRTEMYRPLVNASFAIDWFLSGSASGAPRAAWFHTVNLLLHAVNAGLVYLFFAGLTKRKLGAPLIAAVLWAVHPLAVEPVTWIVGRCDLLAATCGLSAAVLFVRSPGKPRLLWAAAALWGLSLFAKASFAALPLVLAAGLCAYHGVEPKRLASPRIRGRFLVFVAPAVVWIAATTAVLGAPVPVAEGVRWRWGVVGAADALAGTGRAVYVTLGHMVLPVRLTGDYAADPAWLGGATPWVTGAIGWALLLGAAFLGARLLRRHPAGFPLLALVLSLLPVLQFVRIGAIFADRFAYFPLAFAALLVAEGLEHLYYRWGAARGLVPALVVCGVFAALSHGRASAWIGPVAFHRDVLSVHPHDEKSRTRLALALSSTGVAADREEAFRILAAVDANSRELGESLALRGALRLEDGDLARAEADLREAAAHRSTRTLSRAQAFYNLAVCLKRAGRVDESQPLLERALEIEPSLSAARDLLSRLRSPR